MPKTTEGLVQHRVAKMVSERININFLLTIWLGYEQTETL